MGPVFRDTAFSKDHLLMHRYLVKPSILREEANEVVSLCLTLHFPIPKCMWTLTWSIIVSIACFSSILRYWQCRYDYVLSSIYIRSLDLYK